MTHPLSSRALQLAELCRLGHSLEAVQHVPDLLDQVAAQSANWLPEPRQALLPVIRQLLAHQEAEDWLGLADSLEYELIGLLEFPSAPLGH